MGEEDPYLCVGGHGKIEFLDGQIWDMKPLKNIVVPGAPVALAGGVTHPSVIVYQATLSYKSDE